MKQTPNINRGRNILIATISANLRAYIRMYSPDLQDNMLRDINRINSLFQELESNLVIGTPIDPDKFI